MSWSELLALVTAWFRSIGSGRRRVTAASCKMSKPPIYGLTMMEGSFISGVYGRHQALKAAGLEG